MQFTKSAGSEFHSVIDLGKKENLKTSLETFGILYLKAWLLRVLNSLFGIKCSSVFMSTRLWLSLYIKVNLFFFRLVSVSISDQITCLSHFLFCWSFEGKNEQLFFEISSRLKYLICSVGPTRHLRTPLWVRRCWYRPFHILSWGSSRDFSWSTPRIDSPCLR